MTMFFVLCGTFWLGMFAGWYGKELLDADAPEHWYDEDEWRCK